MLPALAVLGVGAVVLNVPPVATVYHLKVLPLVAVALKVDALAFWQYVIGLVAEGAAGTGLVITAIKARGPSQTPPTSWLT